MRRSQGGKGASGVKEIDGGGFETKKRKKAFRKICLASNREASIQAPLIGGEVMDQSKTKVRNKRNSAFRTGGMPWPGICLQGNERGSRESKGNRRRAERVWRGGGAAPPGNVRFHQTKERVRGD